MRDKTKRFEYINREEDVTVSVIDTWDNGHSVIIGRRQEKPFFKYICKVLNYLSASDIEINVTLDDFATMKFYFENMRDIEEWVNEKYVPKKTSSSAAETIYRHEAYGNY